MSPSSVHAAGGVVWRPDGRGGVTVAVVHRPRYDDWSLPKGKRDAGEAPVVTALREVFEETGHRGVVGRPLGRSRYDVLVDGRVTPKKVRWFAVRALGDPEPVVDTDEVDELRWLSPAQARELLTAGRDVDVLDRFEAGPPDAAVALLVRHGHAGARSAWPGPDELRPLDGLGERQAARLAQVLAAFAPGRVVSAPPLRCRQTVAPLADRLGLQVEVEDLLGEKDGEAGASSAWVCAAAAAPAVVLCSQGGLIPDVVATLDPSRADVRAPKGSVWLLALDRDRLLSADPLGLGAS